MPKVLCVPSNAVSKDTGPHELIQLVKTVPEWIERAEAEQDESYLQVIPYIVIRTRWLDPNTGKYLYLRYKRSKTSGEGRLREKISMGIGGHVEYKDKVTIGNVLRTCGERELKEELVSDTEIIVDWENPLSVVNDKTTAVDRVHIGLVVMAYVDNSKTLAVYPGEENVSDVDFYPLAKHKYKAGEENGNYEVWAQRLLSSGVLDSELIPTLVETSIRALLSRAPLAIETQNEVTKDGAHHILYKVTKTAHPVPEVSFFSMKTTKGSNEVTVMPLSRGQVTDLFGEDAIEAIILGRIVVS